MHLYISQIIWLLQADPTSGGLPPREKAIQPSVRDIYLNQVKDYGIKAKASSSFMTT